MTWDIAIRQTAVLLLAAVLVVWMPSAGLAASTACGPQPPDRGVARLDRSTDEAVGFLLAVRCGERYRTAYLLIDGADVRVQPLTLPVVSPQADGFWAVEPMRLRLPPGCEADDCRHRGTYLFARRLGQDDGARRQAALERIRAEVAETLRSAGPDGASRWRDTLFAVGENVVCLHATGTAPTGGPHPAHFDRDGCVRLAAGRLALGQDPLGMAPFFSAPAVERAREQLQARYRAGSFRTDQPQGARSALGPLQADDPRLVLDYRDGVLAAIAVAEASAPYALSQTYRVEVAAEIGPAPPALAPFNPEPPESEAFSAALSELVGQPRHVFVAPAGGLAVALGRDSLAVVATPVPEVLATMPFRADDVVVAEWARGEAALRWQRRLRAGDR